MTQTQLLRHADDAEREAAEWAALGALALPRVRRRDAAALRRMAADLWIAEQFRRRAA